MGIKWFKKKNKSAPADSQPPADSGSTPDKPAQPSSRQAPAPSVVQDATPSNNQPEAIADKPSGTGLFTRLKRGLTKTRDILTTDIDELFSGKSRVDDQMLEDIEELLITSDIGVQTTMDLMAGISRKASKIKNPEELKKVLKQEILALIEASHGAAPIRTANPHVVMVIGVNGVGKTTTIGKLAARQVREGKKVLIAAADTFRAAAVEQLSVWAQRAGADFVRHKDNADPAAVAFDSIEAALARGIDTVFIDTAGRLHTKVNLMEELRKIQRTISKKLPSAPHEILLVLDATTGQNALSQAKLFNESVGITGLVLTKLDGTAKGGIVISICRQLQLPLHYIGVGEDIEDLQPFDANKFVDVLF
jgi:fused signal recognition particle receptor